MLTLEYLEDRCLPAPLAHAQVDVLYVGNNPNAQQMNSLLAFSITTVMPALLGVYGVGAGSLGVIDTINPPTSILTDSIGTPQGSQLQQLIAHEELVGHLPPLDGSQFLVVFVAPGIKVETTGINTPFLGYHTAMSIGGKPLPYAVIPYPQAPNVTDPVLPIEKSLEVSVTHELEEGLCNFTPSIPHQGEVSDLYNRLWFYDNGWHIQVVEGPQGQLVALGPVDVEPLPPPPPTVPVSSIFDSVLLAVEEAWYDLTSILAKNSSFFVEQAQSAQQALTTNPAYYASNSSYWLHVGDQLFYEMLVENS